MARSVRALVASRLSSQSRRTVRVPSSRVEGESDSRYQVQALDVDEPAVAVGQELMQVEPGGIAAEAPMGPQQVLMQRAELALLVEGQQRVQGHPRLAGSSRPCHHADPPAGSRTSGNMMDLLYISTTEWWELEAGQDLDDLRAELLEAFERSRPIEVKVLVNVEGSGVDEPWSAVVALNAGALQAALVIRHAFGQVPQLGGSNGPAEGIMPHKPPLPGPSTPRPP